MDKLTISDETIQEAREVRHYQEDKSLNEDASELFILITSLHRVVNPNHIRTLETLGKCHHYLSQILARSGNYD